MSQHILLTGGAGYIGSHTAKALQRRGFIPVVLDNFSTGNPWAVQWGPLVRADIADSAAIRDTLQHYRISAVIHFAGSAYVGESVLSPHEYFQNNVVKSLQLLKSMQDAGVQAIVFSSSCATYGLPGATLIDESHPQVPLSPYGESKLFIERALASYGKAYSLRSVSLRYFNAAGADPAGDVGEWHVPETHIIPLLLQTVLRQRDHFKIFGADYPTPDGSAVRDFIHVSDLAEAHIGALEYLLNNGPSTALNLGTGRGYSVKEIVAAVESITGEEVPIRTLDRRPGDAPHLVANPALASRMLGWNPLYSGLDTIIRTAWDWYRCHSPRVCGYDIPGKSVVAAVT